MRKLSLFILVTLLVAGLAKAEDDLPPELNRVNAQLVAITGIDDPEDDQGEQDSLNSAAWSVASQGLTVDEAQAAFVAETGHYWQGLPTHTSVPSVDEPLAPDPTRHPTDQPESWASVGIALPTTMVLSLRVDAYNGTSGAGYAIVAKTMIDEVEWIRVINIGPETWREHNWTPYQP